MGSETRSALFERAPRSATAWAGHSSRAGARPRTHMNASCARPPQDVGGEASPVQPPPREAEQPLRHEDNHGDEDDPDRNQIRELVAEDAGEHFAQQQEE